MHIHGNQMNFNGTNPYAAAAEKAAASQKASDKRSKLLKSAGDIATIPNAAEAFIMSKWMDPKQGPAQGNAEYQTPAAGKDSNFG
jgi:hypothetical protein